LAQNFPQAKCLLPERGQIWNEEWQIHREDKEMVLSVESTHLKAGQAKSVEESHKPVVSLGL